MVAVAVVVNDKDGGEGSGDVNEAISTRDPFLSFSADVLFYGGKKVG